MRKSCLESRVNAAAVIRPTSGFLSFFVTRGAAGNPMHTELPEELSTGPFEFERFDDHSWAGLLLIEPI